MLNHFCAAQDSIETASTMLRVLMTADRVYLMPREESHTLLKHTARLLEQASEQLAGGLETDPDHEEVA